MITLFKKKDDCCACGACLNICPKDAISMVSDENGFPYPQIDNDICIECGMCIKTCAYQNLTESNTTIAAYVAASKNKQQIKDSASGGIFAAIATYILEQNGIVYGAALTRESQKFIIKHIGIRDKSDLKKLQGSKYVQSDIGLVFREIKNHLQEGIKVLFSGTPCQCAGLKGFLKKDYQNLILIDIICHGVPSQQLFNDYIDTVFKKFSNPQNFIFRDKSYGWEHCAKIYADDKCQTIPARTTSYFTLFLDSIIHRDNCYSCKYACKNRPGDLTLGDYWGIQEQHPELLGRGTYLLQDGISCIIVNSEKGKNTLDRISDFIYFDKSDYNKIAKKNSQLIHSSQKNDILRTIIFELYRTTGYQGVEKFFQKHYKKQIILHSVFNKLPYRLKTFIRKYKI